MLPAGPAVEPVDDDRAGGPAYLVPLGQTGWSLWRDGALRSAGFPAEGVQCLCDGDLARAVAHLRRKLEIDPTRPKHFLTEPGMGYRYQP